MRANDEGSAVAFWSAPPLLRGGAGTHQCSRRPRGPRRSLAYPAVSALHSSAANRRCHSERNRVLARAAFVRAGVERGIPHRFLLRPPSRGSSYLGVGLRCVNCSFAANRFLPLPAPLAPPRSLAPAQSATTNVAVSAQPVPDAAAASRSAALPPCPAANSSRACTRLACRTESPSAAVKLRVAAVPDAPALVLGPPAPPQFPLSSQSAATNAAGWAQPAPDAAAASRSAARRPCPAANSAWRGSPRAAARSPGALAQAALRACAHTARANSATPAHTVPLYEVPSFYFS